jgi:hypothetical protein
MSGEVAVLITALSGLVAALATLIGTVRNHREIKTGNASISEVKVLVNGRLSEAIDRVAQLTTALENANVSVPDEARQPLRGPDNDPQTDNATAA